MPKKISNTTKAHLISVPLPQHGASYTVISHQFVMDYATQQLTAAGFIISDEEYRCTADGQIAQGIYRLNYNQDPELSMMFAWTNSYNKQVKFKCVVGAYINNTGSVMVSGDIGNWVRKHTGTADTETKDTIDDYITNAHMYYNQLVSDKQTMEAIDLNRRKQSQLLGVLFAEYEILTTEQASMVRDQMKKPIHVFANSDSLWAFYNYVTVALQKSHPRTWMEDQRILHFFISTIGNFQTVAQPQVPTQSTGPASVEENANEDTEEVVDPNQISIYDEIENQESNEADLDSLNNDEVDTIPADEINLQDLQDVQDELDKEIEEMVEETISETASIAKEMLDDDMSSCPDEEDLVTPDADSNGEQFPQAITEAVKEWQDATNNQADEEADMIKNEEIIEEREKEDEETNEFAEKDDFSLDFNEETSGDQDNIPDFF